MAKRRNVLNADSTKGQQSWEHLLKHAALIKLAMSPLTYSFVERLFALQLQNTTAAAALARSLAQTELKGSICLLGRSFRGKESPKNNAIVIMVST